MLKVCAAVTTVALLLGCETLSTPSDETSEGYSLHYIDIGDTGLFIEPARVDNVERRLSTCKDKLIVLFVHGLSGSSQAGNVYVEEFRSELAEIAHDARARGIETVGIYAGWRGQSWIFPWLSGLTFNARRDAARSVAHGQFPELLQRLVAVPTRTGALCTRAPSHKIVAIGHSLGALILFEASWRDLLKQAYEAELRSPNPVLLPRQFARFVLISPAISALDYAPMYEGLKRFRFAKQQEALLELYFAKEDATLSWWFMVGRTAGTLTYDPSVDRSLLAHHVGAFANLVTHEVSALECAPSGSSQSLGGARPSPVRVVRAERVDGFQRHDQVWGLADRCIRGAMAEAWPP